MAARSWYSTRPPGVCRGEGEIGVHAGRPVGIVDVDEIGRTRQQRDGVLFGTDRRGIDLRLVEAGDEARILGFGQNAGGREMALEECAGSGAVLDGCFT